MELNAKQLAFIDEYLVDRNGAQAAVRAGYAPTSARQTANRLLTNKYIRETIDSRTENLAQSHRVDREMVLKGLLRAVQIAEEDRNPSAAARAWAEVNRMCGFNEPERKEVNLNVGWRYLHHIETMPTEELLELVGDDMRDDLGETDAETKFLQGR